MAQAKSQYPPGKTFFDSIRRSFVDVPVDKANGNAISTSEFLEAAESLTTLFGMEALSMTSLRHALPFKAAAPLSSKPTELNANITTQTSLVPLPSSL